MKLVSYDKNTLNLPPCYFLVISEKTNPKLSVVSWLTMPSILTVESNVHVCLIAKFLFIFRAKCFGQGEHIKVHEVYSA